MRENRTYSSLQPRRWVLVLTLLFVIQASRAQEIPSAGPKVSASLDTTTILLGDHIHYRLEAVVPQGYRVVFPELHDTLTPGVEILGPAQPDSQNLADRLRMFSSTYLITSFDSGFHFIPAQPVNIEGSGYQDTLFTQSIPLEVLTLPPDSSITIYDIKSPYGAPLGFREILPWLGGGILILLLAWLIFVLMKRRKKTGSGVTAVHPAEPAHLIALRELEEMERRQLWQKGRVKEYHTRLTEILREYLERRYGIMAMEKTTAEIMSSLVNCPGMGSGNSDQLQEILLRADLVKFARFLPDPSENSISLSQALLFVQNTLAVDVPEPEPPEAENKKAAEIPRKVEGNITEKEEVR